MHVLLALGWMRAYRNVPEVRSYSRFKLLGIALGIAFWATSWFVDAPARYWMWAIGVLLQLALPMYAWATIKNTVSVHHHHLTERHGLFTIIVLGESLLALVSGTEHVGLSNALSKAIPMFLIVVAVWMVYFDWRFNPVSLQSVTRVFTMNYGHLPVYAGLGLVAAGIGLVVKAGDQSTLEFGLALLCGGCSVFLISLSLMNVISGYAKSHWRVGGQLLVALLLLAIGLLSDGSSVAPALWMTTLALVGISLLPTATNS